MANVVEVLEDNQRYALGARLLRGVPMWCRRVAPQAGSGTGSVSGHSRCRHFRDYELSTSSAISKKLTVGATPYNPVTLSRSSSVKKASAASCESHK